MSEAREVIFPHFVVPDPKYHKILEMYCESIENDDKVAGKYLQLAIKRFRKLQGEHHYNKEKAIEMCSLAEVLIKHENPENELLDWQVFLLSSLFGLQRSKDDNIRVTNRMFVMVARKNGKTTFAAMLAVIFLLYDTELRPQIILGAITLSQTDHMYGPMVVMCKGEIYRLDRLDRDDRIQYLLDRKKQGIKDRLDQYLQDEQDEQDGLDRLMLVLDASFSDYLLIKNSGIEYVANGGIVKRVAGKWCDGYNPHLAIHDDFCEHTDDHALINSAFTDMGNRQQPLQLIISTAGSGVNSPCYTFQKEAERLLDGGFSMDNFTPVLFCPDEEDNWNDENIWKKANPSLGKLVKFSFLRREAKTAERDDDAKIRFKTKHLNMWVKPSSKFIKFGYTQ